MGLWTEAMELLHDWVDTATEQSVQTYNGLLTPEPMTRTVWVGFTDVSQGRGLKALERLVEAGAQRVTFTPLNRAEGGGKWSWAFTPDHFERGIRTAKAMGLKVGLGPWVWAHERFMDTCGQQLASLTQRCGGVDYWELDAEGSFEVSALSALRALRKTNPRATMQDVVDRAVAALTAHMPDGVQLEATVLYFNRPAGDALLSHPAVRSATVQAYSVWFPGQSAKARATHAANYQPGVLQERAWENYRRFKERKDLDELHMGVGWWAQDRTARTGTPVNLRLDKPEAFRRASRAAVELGCDGVSAWAMHLWDAGRGVEEERLELACRELRFLASGGISARDPVEAAFSSALPSGPDGVVIRWDLREVSEGPRIPEGYRKIDRRDDPMGLVTQAATALRAQNHGDVLPLHAQHGTTTRTPFEIGPRRYIGIDEMHGATFRGGKQVKVPPPGIHGITVFEHVDNPR